LEINNNGELKDTLNNNKSINNDNISDSLNEFKEIEIDENDSNSMDESEEDEIEEHKYNLLDVEVIKKRCHNDLDVFEDLYKSIDDKGNNNENNLNFKNKKLKKKIIKYLVFYKLIN